MHDDNIGSELATLRKKLRGIENEMESIRNERRRFQRMGFGRDFKDIHLNVLDQERDSCLRRIATLQWKLGEIPPSQHNRVVDMLVIPFALIAVGLEVLQPKKRTTTTRGASLRQTSTSLQQTQVKLVQSRRSI